MRRSLLTASSITITGLGPMAAKMMFFIDPRTPEPVLRPSKTGAPLMSPVWAIS